MYMSLLLWSWTHAKPGLYRGMLIYVIVYLCHDSFIYNIKYTYIFNRILYINQSINQSIVLECILEYIIDVQAYIFIHF